MDLDAGEVAGSMRELSAQIGRRFPGHVAADHVSDAASALDMQLHDGVQRHLSAAADSLTPLNLRRAGIANDSGQQHSNLPDTERPHAVAQRLTDDIRRHILLTRDLQGDASRDGSGRFSGGAGGTIGLANRVLAGRLDL